MAPADTVTTATLKFRLQFSVTADFRALYNFTSYDIIIIMHQS